MTGDAGQMLCPRPTLSHFADEVAGHVELAQRKLEVVLVVQHIEQIRIEGVDVIDLGEVIQDLTQLLMPVGLRVLDLAHVERADAGDGPAIVDNCGRLALGP